MCGVKLKWVMPSIEMLPVPPPHVLTLQELIGSERDIAGKEELQCLVASTQESSPGSPHRKPLQIT
jgi:hypothetical protein